MKVETLNRQVGGDHYTTPGIQHVTFCQRNQIPWCESAAIKYLMRWHRKNGIQDLEKALHYVELCALEEYLLREEAGLDLLCWMDPADFVIPLATFVKDNNVGPEEAVIMAAILGHHVLDGEATLMKAMDGIRKMITQYNLLA